MRPTTRCGETARIVRVPEANALPAGEQRRGQHLAWRTEARPVVRPEVRDQLGLRIGWIRLWLRAIVVGFGIWLTGASLLLWPPVQWAVPLFFYAGLLVMPAAGLLALLAWITPFPREVASTCPGCRHADRVLMLPFRVAHTCRHCRRKGFLYQGGMEIRP